MSMDKIPRRIRVDLYTPAELAIHNAMGEVEKMGADLRLTEAVILLGKAKDFVADFVDGVRPLFNSATEKVAFEKWKEENKFRQDVDVAGITGDYLWRSRLKKGVYTDADLYREFLNDIYNPHPQPKQHETSNG